MYLCVPSISDSEGAQGAARRELATAKLHRRHPNEHHRAAPGTAGGAQVRKIGDILQLDLKTFVIERRASRRER